MSPPSLGLFTYSTLPRGSVVHTAHVADALHDAGWDVTVYALDKDGRGFFRGLRARLCLVPAAPAPKSTADLVRVRTAELVRFLSGRGIRHDVYHAEDCLTANGLLDFRALGHALDVVRTIHHVEAFCDPYLTRCQERSIREVDMCLAVSGAAASDVWKEFGVRAKTITNGVTAARFARVDGERVAAFKRRIGGGAGPVLLAVGGVEERKNTLRILRAFVRIRDRYPAAQLLVLGGATVLDHGAYRAAFDATIQALPPSTRAAVVELGVVADDEVPAIFRAADALTFPSLHEGFGLAALEALAAGLPVVASFGTPFTEFLDPSCATLVDPRSEESIVRGIHRALSLPMAARVAMRDEGCRRAALRSWERVAAMHIDHYEHLKKRPVTSERCPTAQA